MKKFFLIMFLLISTASFAEEVKGIFGIEFGKSPEAVTLSMEEKGWVLSKKQDTRLQFEKKGGTYATIPVQVISFEFTARKFFSFAILFKPYVTEESMAAALVTILKKYDLKVFKENEDEKTYSMSADDKNGNYFKLIIGKKDKYNEYFMSFVNKALFDEYLENKESDRKKIITDDL